MQKKFKQRKNTPQSNKEISIGNLRKQSMVKQGFLKMGSHEQVQGLTIYLRKMVFLVYLPFQEICNNVRLVSIVNIASNLFMIPPQEKVEI
jgi:hypothetical protein